MRRFAIIPGFTLLILGALAGCGGHSSSNNTTNTVSQVIMKMADANDDRIPIVRYASSRP